MTARLTLNRLSIHRGTDVLYDEVFHEGVNIIHGDNGSGKSIITDFIYFALGGDLKEWREEARLADFVLAELSTRDAVITLRRDISDTQGRPMYIFFGSYSEGQKSDIREWQLFPYKRPADGFSFNQILFRAIGIPEAISEGASNITMNQLLRVLYSDQLTPVQRIFRVEPFDTWQTRQAVGDVLCGLGGYDLFELQLELRQLIKDYDEASTRLKSLITIAGRYSDKLLIEHVTIEIANATKSRDKLQIELVRVLSRTEDEGLKSKADATGTRLRQEYSRAKLRMAESNEALSTLEYEVEDAEQFIDHLQLSISDFDDATNTFFALGAVRFEFCPSCFSPITVKHSHEPGAICELCHNALNAKRDETRVLAVKLDLEMQISESRKLQEDRQARLTDLRAELRSAKSEMRTASNALELEIEASQIDTVVADIGRKIGYLDRELEQLVQRESLARELASLTDAKSTLNARISEARDRIETINASQDKRKRIAYTEISEATKKILAGDLQEHSDFGDVDSVTFSFAEDWIAINGNKNRIGSASGMVILKNSFLLGLFASSLNDEQFNLPRFMLMDNIEDKGMVQERSWNFQRLILRTSDNTKTPHQIIFSTSKIAPELENTAAVVGGKYTKQRHSLKIADANIN